VLVTIHSVGTATQRMVDEPDRRAEIDAYLHPLYSALGVTTKPILITAALTLLGHRVGGLRLPLVNADEHETSAVFDGLNAVGLLP